MLDQIILTCASPVTATQSKLFASAYSLAYSEPAPAETHSEQNDQAPQHQADFCLTIPNMQTPFYALSISLIAINRPYAIVELH